MSQFEFTTTDTENTFQFLNFNAGVCGYVTVDRRSGDYTVNRFVDENDNTIDYAFDHADSLRFELDLDKYIESNRDHFEEWDAVSGV